MNLLLLLIMQQNKIEKGNKMTGNKLKSNNLTQEGNRQASFFTLIELMAVISIIVLLMSVLLPALKKSKERASTLQCLNNQKQYNVAMMSYYMDYNHLTMNINYAYSWCSILRDSNYLKEGSVYFCPAETAAKTLQQTTYKSTYGINVYISYYDTSTGLFKPHAIRKLEQVRNPSAACLGADGVPTYNSALQAYWWSIYVNSNGLPDPIHRSKPNVSYFDGHSENISLTGRFDSSAPFNDDFVYFWFGIPKNAY